MIEIIATVTCDVCGKEKDVDLADGSPWDDHGTIIKKLLAKAGWHKDDQGEYCPKCLKDVIELEKKFGSR
jgi:hypothetical protein